MAMTKKDYELVARAINSALKNNENIIDVLADVFSTMNPRFNGDKFVEVCLKDYAPNEKEKLINGIIIGAVYELQGRLPEDPPWMEEGGQCVLLGIDKWDSTYPLLVGSVDGDGDPVWAKLHRLGNMVRLP